jgi:hypothetical protein
MNGSNAAAIAQILDSAVKKTTATLPVRRVSLFPIMLVTSRFSAQVHPLVEFDLPAEWFSFELTRQPLVQRAICQNDRGAG